MFTLEAEELCDYRSLEGSIQWLTQQTRPDFAVHASKGAQCMAKATIRDALTLNRYAADIKSTKDRGLVFRRNIVDLSLDTATIDDDVGIFRDVTSIHSHGLIPSGKNGKFL